MVSGNSNELTHAETCNSNIKADEKKLVYFPLTAREQIMRDESQPFPIDCLHDGKRLHLCTAVGSIGDTLNAAGTWFKDGVCEVTAVTKRGYG
jgi:hypothetical protein